MLFIISLLMGFCACSVGGSSVPESAAPVNSLPQSSPGEETHEYVKLKKTPYKYKMIEDKETVAEIRQIIDSADKELRDEPTGGWAIGADFSDGTQVTAAKETLRINGSEYRTKTEVAAELLEIYEESPAEEINLK